MLYNKIDYIMIHSSKTSTLTDARSYHGTEVDSDHRLVVTRFEIDWSRLYKQKPTSTTKKLNTGKLHDIETRSKYQEKLTHATNTTAENTPWEILRETLLQVAEETVGKQSAITRKYQVQSEKIEQLSIKQKELRIKIGKATSENERNLRTERNVCLKEIKHLVKIEKDK